MNGCKKMEGQVELD